MYVCMHMFNKDTIYTDTHRKKGMLRWGVGRLRI